MDADYQNSQIDAKTAKALAELGRAAARHAGIPDVVPITMTRLPDRESSWCDLCDPNFAKLTEEKFDMSTNDHPSVSGISASSSRSKS